MNGLYGNDFSAVMSADLAERRAREAQSARSLERMLLAIANLGAVGRDNRNFQYRQSQDAQDEYWRGMQFAEAQRRANLLDQLRREELELSKKYYDYQQKKAAEPSAAESAFLRKRAEDAASRGEFDPRAFPDLTHEEVQALDDYNKQARRQVDADYGQLQSAADVLNRQRALQNKLKELEDPRAQKSPYWERNATWINPLGKIADWLAGNKDEVASAYREDQQKFKAESDAINELASKVKGNKSLMSNLVFDPQTGAYKVVGAAPSWRSGNKRQVPVATEKANKPQDVPITYSATDAPPAQNEVRLPSGRVVDTGFRDRVADLMDSGLSAVEAVKRVRAERAAMLQRQP